MFFSALFTPVPRKLHAIFGGPGQEKQRGSPQHVISWGEAERPNINLNI